MFPKGSAAAKRHEEELKRLRETTPEQFRQAAYNDRRNRHLGLGTFLQAPDDPEQ